MEAREDAFRDDPVVPRQLPAFDLTLHPLCSVGAVGLEQLVIDDLLSGAFHPFMGRFGPWPGRARNVIEEGGFLAAVQPTFYNFVALLLYAAAVGYVVVLVSSFVC